MTIKVDNKKLKCNAFSVDKDERIVLLNPLASSSGVWKLFISVLSSNHEVVTIDYPGYGESEYFPLDSISDLASIVSDTLESLPHKSTHIVGFSFGSWVAQQLVLNNSRNISSLILIGSSERIYRQGRHMVSEWLKLSDELGIDYALKQLAYWSFNYETFEQKEDFLESFVYSSRKSFSNPDVFKNQLEIILKYSDELDLSGLKMPILIIRGENDFFYPRSCTKILQQKLTNSRMIEISNAAHAVILENPKDVLKHVMEFLSLGSHKRQVVNRV